MIAPVAEERPLEQRIIAQAYGLGFDLVGIARLGPADTAPEFERWLSRGYAGDMSYLERHAELRKDSRRPAPGTVSAIVVAMDYGGKEPSGPVARYARGDDYHDVMRAKLNELLAAIREDAHREVVGRAYVDTGPLLERDLARRAGLGWFGKNTMLVNPTRGSFLFLGALVVDLELEPSEPFQHDRCGTCTRCLDACPTHAFVGPRELDATRCISYLTIEHRGEIPDALKPLIGEMIYGCDVCQDVCPWNVRFARALPDGSPYAARPVLGASDARALATEILAMTPESYADAFRKSPMKRAKLSGLQRNAAVVLANLANVED